MSEHEEKMNTKGTDRLVADVAPDLDTTDAAPKRRWRLWTIVVALLLLGGGGFFAFNSLASREGDATDSTEQAANEEEEAPTEIPVSVTPVVAGEIASYITATGNLVAENEVMVLAESEGRIARVLVEEGQWVNKGAPLAILVRDDAQIALEKAQVKETNARLAHERGKDLYREELISREAFDKLLMDAEIARQEIAEANWSLEKTTIRSPFAGRATERVVQAGQHVRPGDELYKVTDFDPLIARIYLPEVDVLSLEPGQPVRLSLNADSDVRFEGRIRQISPVVDTATGTVKVTVEAVKPPSGVRPGSFVSLGIVKERHEQALLVPKEAVIRELQQAHLFVVEDGKAVKRSVELGLEEGSLVEAVAGLTSGERVIVAGQGSLRDGAAIEVLGSEDEPQVATTG